MPRKKIKRLNKEYYVTDEYGHTDAVMVKKVNELITVINHQQEIINSFELMMRDTNGGSDGKSRTSKNGTKRSNRK